MKESDWKIDDGYLRAHYRFADFDEALLFVNEVGKIAQTMGHHPDIELYGYNKVCVKTKTHDAGAVTEKDYALAENTDTIEL